MTFLVKVPIYRIGVLFIFGHNREETEQWLKDNGCYGEDKVDAEILDTLFNDIHGGATLSKDEGHRIIVHVDAEDNHRTIAHEIYHAAYRILDWCGIFPGAATEEVYAYLIGYITEEVYSNLNEHGRQ